MLESRQEPILNTWPPWPRAYASSFLLFPLLRPFLAAAESVSQCASQPSRVGIVGVIFSTKVGCSTDDCVFATESRDELEESAASMMSVKHIII